MELTANIISRLRKILQPVDELASAVAGVYKSIWKSGTCDGFDILAQDIHYTFYHFVFADNYLSEIEIKLHDEINVILGFLSSDSITGFRNNPNYWQLSREYFDTVRETNQKDKLPSCLWYLREHDKVHNTKHLEKARNMFLQLGTLVIEIDKEATCDEADALERFKKIIWWQYSDIGITRNTDILHRILQPVSELSIAIESIEISEWEPSDKDRNKKLHPNGRNTLEFDVRSILDYFSAIGRYPSDDAVEVYLEVEIILGVADPYIVTGWQISPEIRQNYKDAKNAILKRDHTSPHFISLRYLLQYDNLYGTNYVKKAQTLFLDLAIVIIQVNGGLTAEQSNKLTGLENSFKRSQLYYSRGTLRKLDSEKFSIKRDSVNYNSNELGSSENSTVPEAGNRQAGLEQLLGELADLIGLDNIKAEVAQLVNFLRIQQLRQALGMETIPISRHLVFYGNPGTGKTTIARLLAKIYKSLNVISKGHLVETERSGLVAGYVGQTALKTQEVVRQAIGGVLFIDEAYTLAGQGQDYGYEAIDTLVKSMEDNRSDLIVIVAGYTDEMSRFLSSNPGLKSRFNKYFYFEDYDASQLVSIFELFCHNTEFVLSDAAKVKLLQIFKSLHTNRDKTFGNARLARNIFEHTIHNQANRLITLASITSTDLAIILDVDISDRLDTSDL